MARMDETKQPETIQSIDAEYLSGKRFPYQEDISEIEDIDLMALTPGQDLNWLEDIELLEEEGVVIEDQEAEVDRWELSLWGR